jgi:hypothetical protein
MNVVNLLHTLKGGLSYIDLVMARFQQSTDYLLELLQFHYFSMTNLATELA